ncbi:MAG: type II toxin-antitoxin system RelE/ParE family toxin [Persicimonas sp.]
MKIRWTDNAARNLDSIRAYIAEDAPAEAARVVANLLVVPEQLEAFPQSGRVVPEYGNPAVREIVRGSYRVIYRLTNGAVEVLSVLHGAQKLPSTPPAG